MAAFLKLPPPRQLTTKETEQTFRHWKSIFTSYFRNYPTFNQFLKSDCKWDPNDQDTYGLKTQDRKDDLIYFLYTLTGFLPHPDPPSMLVDTIATKSLKDCWDIIEKQCIPPLKDQRPDLNNGVGTLNNRRVTVEMNIKKPPSQAEKCHKKVLEELQKNVIIQKSERGPIVLTVLSATRADDDINKAMKEAKIPDDDDDSKRTMLLRILPIADWEADSYRKTTPLPKFLGDFTFLANQQDLSLLECDHNKGENSKMVKFFQSQSIETQTQL